MKIQILRTNKQQSYIQDFDIPFEDITLLQTLEYIKSNIDSTLSFESNCRSGVCGSCALRVNKKEVLSCSYKIQKNDLIEPLNIKNYSVLKDLIIIPDNINFNNIKLLHLTQDKYIKYTDLQQIEKATECINCTSCQSSCPIYEVNGDFLAPFLQVKFLRYIDSNKHNIDQIQSNAIWDCTMCGNCNMVCPAKIDIKGNIMKLRTLSIQQGFNDPNMMNNSFNLDFGFNPNSYNNFV